LHREKGELGLQLVGRMFGRGRLGVETTPDWAPEPCHYFNEFLLEEVFGGIWQRPQLDPKTRSLCTLASLVSLNRPARAVRQHVIGALANGATEVEIVEALVHTAFYAGVSALSEAMSVTLEVFAEQRRSGAAEASPGEHP
jgi:alkylhydroperoxidase/carboxymuconolactone decarboxylase family protein YurZ